MRRSVGYCLLVFTATPLACTSFGHSESPPDDAGMVANETGCLACDRRVFVTSSNLTVLQIGGIAGADRLCNTLAAGSTAPALQGRRFKAWLGDDSRSPSERLTHGEGRYTRSDGLVVAVGWTRLASAEHDNPIDLDESARPVLGGFRVWTGATATGEHVLNHCENWTLVNADRKAVGGLADKKNIEWTLHIPDLPCNDTARLYCVED